MTAVQNIQASQSFHIGPAPIQTKSEVALPDAGTVSPFELDRVQLSSQSTEPRKPDTAKTTQPNAQPLPFIHLPPNFLSVRAIGANITGASSTHNASVNLYQLMYLHDKVDLEVGIGAERMPEKTMNKTYAGIRYSPWRNHELEPYLAVGATYLSSHVLRTDPAYLGGYVKVGAEYFMDQHWAWDASVGYQAEFGLKHQGNAHAATAGFGLNYHF